MLTSITYTNFSKFFIRKNFLEFADYVIKNLLWQFLLINRHIIVQRNAHADISWPERTEDASSLLNRKKYAKDISYHSNRLLHNLATNICLWHFLQS